MAYFPSSRLFAFSLAAGLLLGGCCANNVCDCNDAQEDAIQLHFAVATTPGGPGFAPTELDTIIIQRFPKKFTRTTVPETVTLLRTGTQLTDDIVLRNAAPFAQAGTARLNQYRYVVQYLKPTLGSKPVATSALVIDSVFLQGSFDGSACCTCYHNTAKAVYLNGSKDRQDIQSAPTLTISK